MLLVGASVKDPDCLENVQLAALLVCNIEDPANPLFYDTDLTKQAWQPCRDPSTDPCSDWRFNGLTHVRTVAMQPRDLVYVVGGADIGLTELDLTNVSVPSIGIVENAFYDINADDTLFSVEADPEAPAASDYLYIIGRQFVYAVDRQNLGMGQYYKQTDAGFGNGPAGDAQFLLKGSGGAGADRREIWTLAMQQARYVHRVTDFTQDGGELDAPVSDGYPSAGPTDGAVANFGWDSSYVLTFGGVRRYDISGSEPIPAGYQPAFDDTFPLGNQDFTTEHLELADFGTPGNPIWRLIATTAEGSFFAWELDPISHDPLPGEVKDPAVTDPSYWEDYPTGFTYGNDIATTTIGSDKWVFIDRSNACAQGCTQEFGIGRYNWTADSWEPAYTWEDPNPVGKILPLARDLSVEGDRWLLVAADGGFFVMDLSTGQVTDDVRTNSLDGLSFKSVMGIERYGNRIFASLADPNHRFALAMYAFNATNGQVYDPETGLQSDVPVQALYDGAVGMPDDFPGVFINGGERMSLIALPGLPQKVRLYSGSGNGHVVEVEWRPFTDTMTPLSTWHNGGYFDHVADCNVYKINSGIPEGFSMGPTFYTLRIVVAKTRETFEIVSPPDLP